MRREKNMLCNLLFYFLFYYFVQFLSWKLFSFVEQFHTRSMKSKSMIQMMNFCQLFEQIKESYVK